MLDLLDPAVINDAGTRYAYKPSGSEFSASTSGGTMSCFGCGQHRPRSQGLFVRVIGMSRYFCSETCKQTVFKKKAGAC